MDNQQVSYAGGYNYPGASLVGASRDLSHDKQVGGGGGAVLTRMDIMDRRQSLALLFIPTKITPRL